MGEIATHCIVNKSIVMKYKDDNNNYLNIIMMRIETSCILMNRKILRYMIRVTKIISMNKALR